jgi:hypothetical protein
VLSEINTERPFQTSFKEVCAVVEPLVINIRNSGSAEAEAAHQSITEGLVQKGFITLNVKELISLEVERQTISGNKIKEGMQHGKDAQGLARDIVEVLKHIIYSGIDGHKKFLLSGFPDLISEAAIFEKNCSTISAIIYTTAKGQATVEVKGDDLSHKNIDTFFAKEFRLKTMNEWDPNTFENHLGN